MKQFDQHPLYKKILQEEISRANILMFEYNEKEIWDTLTVTQRKQALLTVDTDMGPDFADEYAESDWLKIPDSITNRINLNSYKNNDKKAGNRYASTYRQGIYNIITDTARFSNTKEMQEYVAKTIGVSAANLQTLNTALINYANTFPTKMMQFNIDVQNLSKPRDTGSSDPNDFNIASRIAADRKKNPNWNYD
jgi:hypothetical protein